MSGHMDKDQIEEFLKSQVVGRLGCTDGDKVYVVPITFAYDNGCIYGHTKDGLKIRMMRKNPNVCFETDWVEDLSNWRSVIAYGTYEELDKDEANKGLDILMDNVSSSLGKKTTSNRSQTNEELGELKRIAFEHSFLSPFTHSTNKEISDIVVYRIRISEMTGKFGNNEVM
jgi:nitroimidazol reductase NimA-like FMN-containing flavoprotein (pyridoxamine 5'-phosphate oxidase superfamily)